MINEQKLADDIGTTRAAIEELKSELEVLETAAKAKGITIMQGELFRVVVIKTKPSKSTSWKKVAMFMEAPASVIKKFSSDKMGVLKVTCSAMIKSDQKAA